MPFRLPCLVAFCLALAPGFSLPAAAEDRENAGSIVDEVLDIDDVALRVRMRLPEGWSQALEYGHTLTAYTQAGGGRALSVTVDPNETLLALGVPEFPLFADGERVESWAGEFAGHPARFFRGRGNERNHILGLGRVLDGTRLVVQLNTCIGAYARPVVVVARGAGDIESLRSDSHLAALSALVTLELPAAVQPCADDLAEGLGAVAVDPPAGEGWVRREALGLSVTLPARFEWHSYPGDAGFAAQDVALPDDWFMSVFTDRIERADIWRDELPPDADIRALSLDDEALAARFEAHRVAFDGDDGEGHAIILVSPQPGENGGHLALVMLSLGQPAARALPRLGAILSRLEAAED
ncbi:MAG: hypothetical protein JJT95_03985 [Pararhodobacter sp.]|nr:hypothetical protein [Pararhodobacter sp.]